MGDPPIAESGSTYDSQYLSEGLKILATHPQRQSHSVRHSSVRARVRASGAVGGVACIAGLHVIRTWALLPGSHAQL